MKKLTLVLSFLTLAVAAVPRAQADDHYGRLKHEIRRDERRGDYREARRDRRELRRREGYRYGGNYYHNGRYYSGRRYRYRNGRRYYSYFGLVPGGVSVNVGL